MSPLDPPAPAIVLAGGTGRRLGGVDKATITIGGVALLDRVLSSLGPVETVVVGPPRGGLGPNVRCVRESPAGSGPLAGLYAGLDAFDELPLWVRVAAVDQPWLTTGTWERLATAAIGHDAAFLHDSAGGRQVCGVVRADALLALRPDPDQLVNGPLRRVLDALDSAAVPAAGREAEDIDTAADLERSRLDQPQVHPQAD